MKQYIVKTTVALIVKHDNIRILTTKCTILRLIVRLYIIPQSLLIKAGPLR